MLLYGSHSSPFVRRLRIWAQLHAIPFEFIAMDIMSDEDRDRLAALNPARKIPVLIDGDQSIADSGVIFRYLQQKFQQPALDWYQENLLTLINACNDSLVELLLCQRSGFDTTQDKLFFNLQHNRIATTLGELENQATGGAFGELDYVTISLYCLLDWVAFRELTDLTPYKTLNAIAARLADNPAIQNTDPRGH